MLKVFLVEDEFVIREGIKNNIDWKAHGYEFCGEAGDGELAYPMIQKLRPDIVITDIRMPFMDGLELSRLIRKELPDTEIIILSGYQEFEYAKEAIKLGVAQYLSKPINGGELLAELDELSAKIEEKRIAIQIRERYLQEMEENNLRERKKLLGIKGGHIILLNSVDSEYYEDTKEQAVMALEAYPQGLQVGGGITADNAMEFIDAGAAAVIVTSYVFKDGRINYANLNRLKDTVGSDRLVLDLSCRKKDGQYYIVTDRWQNFTDEAVTTELLDKLSSYCCEFLVHAVDVEGRVNGIEKELVAMLGSWGRIPVTYAGGVSSFDDLKCIRQLGQNHLNVTIGSALDLFGGEMEYDKVIAFCNNKEI